MNNVNKLQLVDDFDRSHGTLKEIFSVDFPQIFSEWSITSQKLVDVAKLPKKKKNIPDNLKVAASVTLTEGLQF